MALDKKTLNDFLPNGFETQNKTDYKANFSNDKIAVGFDKDTLEVLSGPNLNNLLDKTGKNFHTLNDFLNYFNQMPIGSFPIVNTSNQLDYKSINSFFRNVGEIVPSLIPLDDGNLRLLDGSLLENNITYSRFISYMAGLRSTLPNLFTTEANWQAQVQQYGECGKFVYNTTNKSLRLPKIVTYLRGTNDSSVLGDLVEAGIPQHTHGGTTSTADKAHNHGRGTMDITGRFAQEMGSTPSFQGAFYKNGTVNNNSSAPGGDSDSLVYFQASRAWTGRTPSESIAHNHTFTTGNANNNIYKSGINTVNTQAIRVFYYIVVSVDEAEKQVLSAVYNYKGSVDTYEELPTDASIGEVYNVIGEDPEGYSGANFAWTGEVWDRLGGTVNLSGYLTKTEAGNVYATKASLESNVDDLQEQINTNASNIANIASQEVIAQGIQKIEALKFASTIGHGISSDTDMFAAIKKYAHSSFDRSKFPVVGSPTITADGIASGFSNSNRLVSTINIPNTYNKLEILSPIYNMENNSDTENYVVSYANAFTFSSIYGLVAIRAYNVTESNFCLFRNYTGIARPSVGDSVQGKIVYENNTCTAYYKNITTGSDWIPLGRQEGATSPTTPFPMSGVMNIGAQGSNQYYKRGWIDLKQFSITVDGKEVFNGNKEGLDVIKPDDYTVVGSPTITDNGVLVCSTTQTVRTNYITTGALKPQALKGKSWEIKGSFYTGGGLDTFNNNILAIGNVETSGIIYIPSADTLSFACNIGTSQSNKHTIGKTFTNIPKNTVINFSYKFDYRTKIYTFSYNDALQTSDASSYDEFELYNINTSSTQYSFQLGSLWQNYDCTYPIDLNSFRIYVDGQLVYQPCLKIPYKLSNTNLKITQEMNRAIDMADQCGYSQYFGLNESDMTCLVPQGDNITGRRDLVHREEDNTTHYVTEKYSDLYCKQMASCTANTAVTFAQPYKDEYYKLSVPYSAKTRTGFTPTVSGDWTAEGYTYLT